MRIKIHTTDQDFIARHPSNVENVAIITVDDYKVTETVKFGKRWFDYDMIDAVGSMPNDWSNRYSTAPAMHVEM